MVATVPEMDRAARPCFVKARGMATGSYTRGGHGDRLLTDYEICLLHSNRGQPRDDHEAVHEATPGDLDPDAVARLLRRVRQREPRAFGAVGDETAVIRLGILRTTSDGQAHDGHRSGADGEGVEWRDGAASWPPWRRCSARRNGSRQRVCGTGRGHAEAQRARVAHERP